MLPFERVAQRRHAPGLHLLAAGAQFLPLRPRRIRRVFVEIGEGPADSDQRGLHGNGDVDRPAGPLPAHFEMLDHRRDENRQRHEDDRNAQQLDFPVMHQHLEPRRDVLAFGQQADQQRQRNQGADDDTRTGAIALAQQDDVDRERVGHDVSEQE